jgi:lysophosphatidylcholine acyltransferase/lyso-PAF acetyltransferase
MAATEESMELRGGSILHDDFGAPVLTEFPLGLPPTIGPLPRVNPFHESSTWPLYQVVKTVLNIPLLFLRLWLMVSFMAFAWVCIKVALLGVSDPLFKPFNRLRRFLLWSCRLVARAVLACMGYYYIPIKGKPAHRSVAPIIVSNHIGFVDPIFVFYRHLPVIVSAKENVEMPIIGMFLQALQVRIFCL